MAKAKTNHPSGGSSNSDFDGLSARGFNEALHNAASPDLYNVNGFRVLELPVDATQRDVSRRRTSVDRAITHELEIPVGPGRAIPLLQEKPMEQVIAASHRLDDLDQRLVDEFFWFWPADTADEAMAKLKEEREKEAEAIWLEREGESDDLSIARHNLAVYYHLRALDAESGAAQKDAAGTQKLWDKAYRRWAEVASDEVVWRYMQSRIKELDDPRLTSQKVDQLRSGLTSFLTEVTAGLAIKAVQSNSQPQADRLLKTLRQSQLDQQGVQKGLQQAISTIKSRLSAMCKAAEATTDAKPEAADDSCRHLIAAGGALLQVVDGLLEAGDRSLVACHDELAERILACATAYANRTCDWDEALRFLTSAMALAVSPALQEKVRETTELVQKRQKTGDDFCAPGYFQAPEHILSRLEAARKVVQAKNHDEAVRLLTELLKVEIDELRKTKTIHLVRKALAFTLGDRGWTRRRTAIAEYNESYKKYQRELLEGASNNLHLKFLGGRSSGFLYCNVCGAMITGQYRTVTIEGIQLDICLRHSPPGDSTVNAAIKKSAQDYVDAHYLDPSNNLVADNLKQIREECTKEHLQFPTLSPWIQATLGSDAKSSAPAKPPAAVTSKPTVRPTNKPVPAGAIPITKWLPVVIWVLSIVEYSIFGLLVAPILSKWFKDLNSKGESLTAFWVVSGVVYLWIPVLLICAAVFH